MTKKSKPLYIIGVSLTAPNQNLITEWGKFNQPKGKDDIADTGEENRTFDKTSQPSV